MRRAATIELRVEWEGRKERKVDLRLANTTRFAYETRRALSLRPLRQDMPPKSCQDDAFCVSELNLK